MLLGTGIDIVDIERVERLYGLYGDKLSQKVLNTIEYQDMILITKNDKQKAIFLAKRFAIKEAVVKAIGCGIGSLIGFHDIIIIKNKLGTPMIKKNPIITSVVRKLHHIPSCEIFVSISDEKRYVVAIANLTTGKEHHAVDVD